MKCPVLLGKNKESGGVGMIATLAWPAQSPGCPTPNKLVPVG